MAKIKITESELRQLIGENVVSVLNETRYNTYSVNWEDLTEPQQKEYARMYGNAAKAGQYVDANGNVYQKIVEMRSITEQIGESSLFRDEKDAINVATENIKK